MSSSAEARVRAKWLFSSISRSRTSRKQGITLSQRIQVSQQLQKNGMIGSTWVLNLKYCTCTPR